MRNFKTLLLIFAAIFPCAGSAYVAEEGKITATLGPFLYKSDFRDTPTGAISPRMGGFGVIALGDVNEKGSLEIAMFYLNKVYLRERAGSYISEQTQLMQITMGYRRWLTPTFSAGLGLFSAYSMGEPKVDHSDFAPGLAIDTSARDTTEYGLDFSLQAELWSRGHKAILLDGRYSLSLTAKENERANHYGVMLAFRYLVQKKNRDEGP